MAAPMGKSPAAAIILAAGKPKMGPPPVDEPAEAKAGSEGLDAAADEILAAFKNEDASALKGALESFVEILISRAESEEGPEEG